MCIRDSKWVVGSAITESINTENDKIRRYTATIRGWRGWKIYEGQVFPELPHFLFEKVREIRDRIDKGDETVFHEKVCLENIK